MRAFACPRCGNLVFFENNACLRCGVGLGFDHDIGELVVADGRQRCINATQLGCNWLMETTAGPGPPEERCRSCRLTRTIPGPREEDVAALTDVERAKRRLVFQLDEIRLPVAPRLEPDGPGLAFDLLSSQLGPVTTGHEDGVITIDVAESDHAHRESLRHQLGEPYRTVLGHLRHEIGHYYWPLLVDNDPLLARSRDCFGDERLDYGEALARHYADGPPADWASTYVSAYATMHPWEDWAETFAHYLHILDTLQTAAAFGMLVTGPAVVADSVGDPTLVAVPNPDLDHGDFDAIVGEWLPLTYALNAVNRSMGRDDLYPFVLPPAVLDKLVFVHELVRTGSRKPLARP
jgi:hypothetical protein